MNKSALIIGLIALLAIAALMYFFLRSPKVEGFRSLRSNDRMGCPCTTSSGGCGVPCVLDEGTICAPSWLACGLAIKIEDAT